MGMFVLMPEVRFKTSRIYQIPRQQAVISDTRCVRNLTAEKKDLWTDAIPFAPVGRWFVSLIPTGAKRISSIHSRLVLKFSDEIDQMLLP